MILYKTKLTWFLCFKTVNLIFYAMRNISDENVLHSGNDLHMPGYEMKMIGNEHKHFLE